MFRLFVLLLALTLSLNSLSNDEILKRANSYMNSSVKSDYFRAYNDYKNIYLRSIMKDNDHLRINALKGIVRSGDKLHIDVSQYSEELASLQAQSLYKKPKKIETKKIFAQKKKEVKQNFPQKKKEIIKVNASNKLKSAGFENGDLVLTFEAMVGKKQVNYFTLYNPKEKQYRYVFDIASSMLSKSRVLRKKGIKRIKIAQFQQNTLRLVVEDTRELKVAYELRGKQVVIGINKKISPKQVVKKKKEKVVYKTPVRLDRSKVIVIDAGHGGKDPGAVGYRKYREKVVVVDIAKKLRSILRTRGYKVYMTRDRDKFIKLSKRTEYANRKDADIFVSIHANAVGKKNAHKVHGIECYFLSKSKSRRAKDVAAKENSADLSDMNYYGKTSFLNTLNSHNIVASNKLAIDLQRGMLGSLKKTYKNVHDGGVREGPFWVLVGAKMPSVLVEVGFITHPREARNLVNKKYQEKLARGMANGIERYFINSN